MPRYDGRPTPGLDATQVLLWIPRGLLLPLHLAIEFLVRRPLVGLINFAERNQLPAFIPGVFVWWGGRILLAPTFFFDFGMNPSVGLYFRADDLGLRRHRWVLRAATWGADWLSFVSTHTLLLPDGKTSAALVVGYIDRPDYPFYGVGPDAPEAGESFYSERLVEAQADLTRAIGPLSAVSLTLLFRDASFGPGHHPWLARTDSPSIEVRHDVGDPAQVPGYGGYDLLAARLGVALDDRDPRRAAASLTGLRLEAGLTGAVDPTNAGLRFLRWGGDAAALLDVSGAGHVLGLGLHVELVDPAGPVPVPFTELATLGGARWMQGFLPGRFRGRSAAALTADYRWPIWTRLDARIFLAAGNAFGPRFEGFAVDHLHLSWGFGLRTSDRRDASIEMLLGFGSSRLDAASFSLIDDVRFVVGINHGF